MKSIYLAIGGQAVGPFTHDEVKKGLKDGRWHAKTRAWHPGLEGWTPLHQIEMDRTTVTPEFATLPPPIPPSYSGEKTMLAIAVAVALVLLYLYYNRDPEPQPVAQLNPMPEATTQPQTIASVVPSPGQTDSPQKEEISSTNTMAKPAATNAPEISESKGERLESVFFEKNSAAIDPTADSVLQRSITLLKSPDYPKFRSLSLVGYASSEGSVAENEDLSLRRANSVKELLRKAGLQEEQLVVMPGGQANKAAEDDPNPKMNRRVEIFVVR
jgi:outer membrane protein OmpA-like peptidoglycan-associated protein